MREIKFEVENMNDTELRSEKPLVRLSRVESKSNDTGWVNRISMASILLEAEGLTNEDERVCFSGMHYSLGAHIGPNTHPAVIEIGMFENFQGVPAVNMRQPDKWQLKITLKNIELLAGEEVVLHVMEREYIARRICNWQERVESLFEQIEGWCDNLENVTCDDPGNIEMSEQMMVDFKLPAIDMPSRRVLHNGNVMMFIKPYGLWIIGANGRIDVIGRKSISKLVNKSDFFEASDWHLFLRNDKVGHVFNRQTFSQLIHAQK